MPDLELFPRRYASVASVTFRAGTASGFNTLTLWLLSWLVRGGLVNSLSSAAGILYRIVETFAPFGSDWSAMSVTVTGRDSDDRLQERKWLLAAGDNHGPNIPCLPPIALSRKLLRDELSLRGAMPCMGLLSVDEILKAAPNLNLRIHAH